MYSLIFFQASMTVIDALHPCPEMFLFQCFMLLIDAARVSDSPAAAISPVLR